MFNPDAFLLVCWAAKENNRVKAQKILRAAENMENRYRECHGFVGPDISIGVEYDLACRIHGIKPPRQ
jgi:hypothetical protein